MRCSARAHELRPARGRPVKVNRFACPQPQHPLINAHARALHQPLVPPVFRCNQHPSRAAHLQPHAQPQDDATPSVDDLLSQLDDLAIPDIDQDLRTFQEQAGALFLVRYVSHTGRLTQSSSQDASSPPVSFGNEDAAEDALMTGAVVVDRYVHSHTHTNTHAPAAPTACESGWRGPSAGSFSTT